MEDNNKDIQALKKGMEEQRKIIAERTKALIREKEKNKKLKDQNKK